MDFLNFFRSRGAGEIRVVDVRLRSVSWAGGPKPKMVLVATLCALTTAALASLAWQFIYSDFAVVICSGISCLLSPFFFVQHSTHSIVASVLVNMVMPVILLLTFAFIASRQASSDFWQRRHKFLVSLLALVGQFQHAAAIEPVAGANGRALTFDGTTTKVSVNLQCTNPIYSVRQCKPLSGFSHLSIGVWVYPNLANSAMTIVDRGGIVGQREFQMSLTVGATNTLQINLGNYSRGGGDWKQTISVTLPAASMLNTWTHLAFTYNGTSGQLVVYHNGAQVSVSNGLNAFQLPSFLPTGSYLFDPAAPWYLQSLAGQSLTIGAMQSTSSAGGASTSFFSGRIDQLQIYGISVFGFLLVFNLFVFSSVYFDADTPLNALQVLTNSRIPLNRTGVYPFYDSSLRAYYAFDEGTGSQIVDLTMNQNMGTLAGTASWQTPSTSPFGSAAYGYADIPQVLQLSGTSATGMPQFIAGQDLTVKILSLPTNGLLYVYNPFAVDFMGSLISAVPFTIPSAFGGNRVLYAPGSTLSNNIAPLDSITFSVQDSAGQVSSNTATLAIWVQQEDYGGSMEVPLPYATSPVNISLWSYTLGINYVTFGVNSMVDQLTVTLSCNLCALNFGNNNSALVSHMTNQPTGITTVSQGNNQLVFSGNVNDVNNALGGIVYTRMPFYSGGDQVNITIYSAGHFFYAGTAVTVEKMPLALSINSIPVISSFVPAMIPANSNLGLDSFFFLRCSGYVYSFLVAVALSRLLLCQWQ
jgi:hypothetical protein